MEANPILTLDELAGIVDHRLQTGGERALQNAKDVFETDK
jgi:hypothetical protein